MRRVRLHAQGAEGDAARAWLESLGGITLVSSAQPLSETDLLWLHDTARPPAGLMAWLQSGGRLLATLGACDLPHQLGIEPVPPDDHLTADWDPEADEYWLEEFKSFKAFPHVRGFAGFGPHPLFAGLHQGAFTWAPSPGEPWQRIAYREARPEAGGVVATERAFIHLNPERVIAWEHPVGAGGILCLGAYVSLSAPDDLLARQLRALLANAIAGDAIPHKDRVIPVPLWPTRGERVQRDPAVPVPEIPGAWGHWPAGLAALVEQGAVQRDEPWTLAGRRVLLAGGERAGLREVWCHPFRVMRQVRVRTTLAPEPVEFAAGPDQLARWSDLAGSRLTEHWATALELPVLLWDLEVSPPVPLEMEWEVDLRRMWPYPAGSMGDLRWNLDDTGQRLWIGCTGGSVQLLFQLASGQFTVVPREQPGTPPALVVRATAPGSTRLVVVAAADGDELAATLRALERKGLDGLLRQRAQHASQVLDFGTSLSTPEPLLDRAFDWARLRCDSFVAETPGIGRSLLAGYAESRPGWGDGRPGYAWYFGRDACWTAFAQLAAGDREGPRDVLRFLSRTQDVSGKVLHEYTTSGLVHYDAADSTPLYLLLAGRYGAWTGDVETLERCWPAIERGYRFCLETDRDGDGLIENSRVGHGWIEHGPLGGTHVTLYLAACWVAALESVARVAERLDHRALAEEMEERVARARTVIRERFLVKGEYALGLHADGAPLRHRTAMLAVPILLGVVDPADSAVWLDEMAGDGFSAPWGVRMLATTDPLFDPAGYHRGAVWPLYTGWTSLAEWRAGRFDFALRHLMANARLPFERERGAFDEVLHGTEHRSAGVCPDQAWSAAMVPLPVIEGLFGVSPNAIDQVVTLAPALPADWNRMRLGRLRVGRSVLHVEVRRRPGLWTCRIERAYGPHIQVRLRPRDLPEAGQVLLDGVEMGRPDLSFLAVDRHEVTISLP